MALDNLNIKLSEEQQKKIVLIVVISGGLLFGYWNYLYKPLVEKYNSKMKILKQKKEDLRAAREMVMKYPEFLQKSEEITKRIEFMNKRLPKDRKISELIKDITLKATENGIKIISFSPGKEKNKGDYTEIEIGVSLKTSFNRLGNFLTSLGYIERILSPSNLDIKIDMAGLEKGEGLDVNMKIKAYSFNQ